MSISLLSTTALGATTALAGAMPASRNAWTTLGQKLSSGDMESAQSAFSVYKRLISNAANNLDAQFTSDLNDLGTALNTNDLTSARDAYQAVSKDVASDPVLAIRNAAATAEETGNWISTMIDLGSSSSSSSSTASDPYAAILNSAYDRLSSSISSGSSSSDSYLQSAYGTSDASSTDASSYLKLVYGNSSTKSSSSNSSSTTSDIASSLLDICA